MSGFTLNLVTTIPFMSPTMTPTLIPAAKVRNRLPPVAFTVSPATSPARATTAPTERSKPPQMSTRSIPTATIAVIASGASIDFRLLV